MLLNAMCHKGVWSNIMRGWVSVQFPEKKRYVTLEWLMYPWSCDRIGIAAEQNETGS